MKSSRVKKSWRSARGIAVALPMVVIALMVILVVGFFSFEVARTAVARDQLRASTESAALAGAATMASSTTGDISATQANAIAAATDMFKHNEILGTSLSSTTVGITTPQVGQAQLEFQFLDPSNNNAPVPAGDPKGKLLEVSSSYGLPALAGEIIGIGNGPLPLTAKSSGGVGEIDVVLCFDCSGSMRFSTKLSRVRRIWNNTLAKVEYVVTAFSNSIFGGMRPQNINGLNVAMRGENDNALPGNFPPGTAPDTSFTDLVVNLDEQTTFTSFEEGGFSFPNLAALVEASRGNLENQFVFESSGASTVLTGVVTPQPGYQAKYFELARKHTHPWIESQEAAQEFFTIMKQNTRAHFGFVAFASNVGQDANQSVSMPNVGQVYPAGGIGLFPFPAVSLNSAEEETNFEQVQAAITGVVPLDGTNIGGSIERAVRMFTPLGSRANAKKAIILFTDGFPTVGQPLSANPLQNCVLAAQQAHDKGIAVFSVGLALEDSVATNQGQVLNTITNTAGNGGKVFQVSDPSKLKKAFGAIARNLTQIVQ